jgi:hypothetical protein
MGCNPRTKDPVSVSEKLVPAFKAAKEMHQRLNPPSLGHRNRTAFMVSNAADIVSRVDAYASVASNATTASASHDAETVSLHRKRAPKPDGACAQGTE